MSNREIPYILVVEDSSEYARSLQIFLQQEGFRTRWASDTLKARHMIDEEIPDLVLLDIALPDENGIEFCRTIRRHPDTESLPVVILSAHLEMATFLAESEEGADLYLDKALTFDELLEQIRPLIQSN